MFIFLIHLPHLTVLPCFFLTLRSIRISIIKLTVREFMRLNVFLLRLSSCMSATGGLAHEATVFYKHLVSLLLAI